MKSMLTENDMYYYQKYAADFMFKNGNAGALMDMGLGKTISTLTCLVRILNNKLTNKILVIAPKKVAESVWIEEKDKWEHTKHLTFSQILGTQKQRKQALQAKADIYIINRENIAWLVGLYGNNWPFDTVVIDELSSFKNHKSQRFKSLRLIRNYIRRVIGLTGTPAPNGLLDVWSQLYLLDKGESLGENYNRYRETYFEPGKRDGFVVFSYTLKKGNVILGDDYYKNEIMQRISRTCFSMRTEDYLQLPDRLDNDIIIKWPSEVMAKYKDFEREKVMEIVNAVDEYGNKKEITAINAATLTNKLLQFANGAIYDAKKNYHTIHDEKLDKLDEVIEELDEKPLMVFYSFQSDKERIMSRYKFARELNTPQDVVDWNNKKIKLLVAHPASAGHGLNLQFGGQNMLWFGLPWSLELYQQGLKRIHRNGVKGVVVNSRLIVKETMDESVLRALNSKDDMQNEVINAVKAIISEYQK